nr:MAG TPA: hypothetical protein [Caudoviricetes sp.]
MNKTFCNADTPAESNRHRYQLPVVVGAAALDVNRTSATGRIGGVFG